MQRHPFALPSGETLCVKEDRVENRFLGSRGDRLFGKVREQSPSKARQSVSSASGERLKEVCWSSAPEETFA